MVADNIAENDRSDYPGGRSNQHIIAVNIGPVLTARWLIQAAIAPVVNPIIVATEAVRCRVAATEVMALPRKMVTLAWTTATAMVVAALIVPTIVMAIVVTLIATVIIVTALLMPLAVRAITRTSA